MKLSQRREINRLADQLEVIRATHAAAAEGLTSLSVILRRGPHADAMDEALATMDIDVHDPEFSRVVQELRACLERTAADLVDALRSHGVDAGA